MEKKPGRPSHSEEISALKAQVESLTKLIEGGAIGKESGDVKELVLALRQEDKRKNDLFRASSQGFKPNYQHNRDNFKLVAEAEKIAKANGHAIGEWYPITDNPNRKPQQKVRDAYHTECMTCGADIRARWMPPPVNDKRRAEEKVGCERPQISGKCVTHTEQEILQMRRNGVEDSQMSSVPSEEMQELV